MKHILQIAPDGINARALEEALDQSLHEADFMCPQGYRRLETLGIDSATAVKLIALHKSDAKYGFPLSHETLSHLLSLGQKEGRGSALFRLSRSPFWLLKAGWVYEHAPYFILYGQDRQDLRDALIRKFAEDYETRLINSRVDLGSWGQPENPKRVLATTFWERKIIDPLLLMEKALKDQLEGIELCVDYHPFNYAKLLPEEISAEKRQQMREAAARTGLKIDIHSPIVGPYCPSPDPSLGTQRFFNPATCLEVQYETVDLAKDMGAGAVVCHLIDATHPEAMAGLIERAGGSPVRVTIENYCQIETPQTSEYFISALDSIYVRLSKESREQNLGVTLDVGHLNIEGQDPLVGAEQIATWCKDKKVYLRVHATDNYGNLLFSPPAYSADVHSNISGRGINNALIIKLLRSFGYEFNVVAEQIQPLTPDDIATIHEAQSYPLDRAYEGYVERGKEALGTAETGSLIESEVALIRPYQFVAGLEGVPALGEYLVYRKIQEKKSLSVDEAKRISQEFMRMPRKVKSDLTRYIDDLLLPIQTESGAIQKSGLDLICQNISGALFGTISNEHLNRIFSREKTFLKDDVICEQGSVGTDMYYLKEGEVGVYLDDIFMAALGPGEIFGEMSLFYEVNKSATIRVSSVRAKVGLLNREGLENLFKGGQPYARDLIHRLYSILPERLRNLNDKYKTAIRSLYLILHGDVSRMPNLDHDPFESPGNKQAFLPILSDEDKRLFYRDIRKFGPDQTVFEEGERGDGAYFIIQGRMKVTALSDDAKQITLGELGEGDIFGEMSLIDDKPRSASVVTLTPCEAAFVTKTAFDQFIETGADLATRLMGFISLSLFRRILRLDRLYSDIKQQIRNEGDG